MKFSLIICTYMRPQSVLQLLQSVQGQTLYPDEILIIDGSEFAINDTIWSFLVNLILLIRLFLVNSIH